MSISHIIRSHLVFRPLPDSLKCITQKVREIVRELVLADGIEVGYEFNSVSVIAYVGHMVISSHRDARYKKDGSFDAKNNSQEENSIVATLVIGDPRTLQFNLFSQGKKDKKVRLKALELELEHGGLSILYPSDEKPLRRSVYDDDVKGLTYYKHSCSGLKTKNSTGMSIGLVFRVSRHQAVVHKDTGLIALSREYSNINGQLEIHSRTNENKKSKTSAKILKKFLEEKELKQQWDSLYEDGMTNIIDQYFSTNGY